MTLLSVDRTLVVIEILVDRGDVGVLELAAQLGVAPSTVHRMLETLEMRGFVTQDTDSRRYLPGPRLSGLSCEIDIVTQSRGLVEKLGRATGWTVHIGVLDGQKMRYLHHWAPASKFAVGNRVGTVMPAHATSSGKALLSLSPRDQIVDTFPPSLHAPTPAAISNRGQLFEELRAVRRLGYARNIGESEPEVVAFAVPILHSRLPFALNVSAWRQDIPVERGRVCPLEQRIVDLLSRARDSLEINHQVA